MSKTAVKFRAHFDGKNIIPHHPVELPVDQPFDVELWISPPLQNPPSIEERLRRLALAAGRLSGPDLPAEALSRENLYEERHETAP